MQDSVVERLDLTNNKSVVRVLNSVMVHILYSGEHQEAGHSALRLGTLRGSIVFSHMPMNLMILSSSSALAMTWRP